MHKGKHQENFQEMRWSTYQTSLHSITFLPKCYVRKSWGKRAAIVRRYPAFFVPPMCCVLIPQAVRPTLLRQIHIGSLTCTYIWVHAVHMHKQVCTKVDSEGQKNCLSPCPTRTMGSNSGSWEQNSDALPLSYVPQMSMAR